MSRSLIEGILAHHGLDPGDHQEVVGVLAEVFTDSEVRAGVEARLGHPFRRRQGACLPWKDLVQALTALSIPCPVAEMVLRETLDQIEIAVVLEMTSIAKLHPVIGARLPVGHPDRVHRSGPRKEE